MENIQTIQKKATFKELKERARKSIKGNYLKCLAVPFLVQVIGITLMIVVSFISLLIFGNPAEDFAAKQYIVSDGLVKEALSNFFKSVLESNILSGIVSMFVVLPLTVGQNIFFLNNFRNGGENIEKLFSTFTFKNNTYLRSIGISLLKTLYTILWSIAIVCPIGMIISAILFMGIITTNSIDPNTGILMLIIYLLVGVGINIFLLRYAFIFYLFEDDKHLKVSNIISKSIRLMKGNKIRLFLLSLSFIGWIILSLIPGILFIFVGVVNQIQNDIFLSFVMASIGLIVCLLGVLFVNPYIQSTFAAFYDDIRQIDDENKIAKNATKVNLNIITEDKKED